jgi:uncharacterized protein
MVSRSVLITVSIVVVVAALMLAFLWLVQRSLIYLPDRSSPMRELMPAGGEEVRFTTDDGVELAGWFVPALGRRVPGPGVVVFNGNAGHRGYRAPLAEALAAEGASVLLVDYRGYGGNPGSPSETGLMADARAAAGYLAGRREVDPERVVYFGESLGGAVAVALAAERSPAALVLRSPFASLAAMGRHHYPWLPVVDALLLDRFAAVRQIGAVRVPLLVIVASDDEIVPVGQSRALFEAANEPKRWLEIRGARHNDGTMLDGEELIEAVAAFLREHGVAQR